MIALFTITLGLLCDVVLTDLHASTWTCVQSEQVIATFQRPPAMKPVIYRIEEQEWDDLPDVVGMNGFER